MIKKILVAIAVLLVIAAGFIYSRTLSSGDIDKYQSYFVDDIGRPDSSVRVTFFGVSTLLIDDGETQILIDGFFSRYSMTKVLTSDISSDTAVINHFISDYN